MMKNYKTYIKENIENIPDGLVDFLENIKYECSDYLDIIKDTKKMLWRGIGADFYGLDFAELEPIENRKPVDTPLIIQEIADDMMFDKFGWYPRSEGVFTFQKMFSTTQYGEAFMFFPTNDFKYVWSPDVIDFFMKIKKITNEPFRNILNNYGLDNKEEIDKTYEFWKDSLDNDYLEPEERISKEQFSEMFSEKWIKEKIKPIIDSYTDEDMKLLLNSKEQKELIIGCDNYYIINYTHSDFVKKFLGIEINI